MLHELTPVPIILQSHWKYNYSDGCQLNSSSAKDSFEFDSGAGGTLGGGCHPTSQA